MKAAVVTAPNTAPVYADFPDPPAGPHVVRVRAAAITHLTRSRASGAHYSSANAFPAIAGVDGVGTLPDGRRVYFILPEAPYGALAELCPVDPRRTLPLPDLLDDVTAAALANPGMSAWAALVERAHLVPGETVLVNGATGSAGRIAVQFARYLGAKRVIATGRNPQELANVGADLAIPLDENLEPALIEAFAGGIDIVLDYLWGASALAAISAIAKAVEDSTPVRFVNIGSVTGAEIALPAAALRSSSIVMMGSGLKSVPMPALFGSIAKVFEAVGPAGLRIATSTAPLAAIEQAWAADTGKPRLVITP